MRGDKRTQAAIIGAREAQRLAATLGGDIRVARSRRGMSIGDLVRRVGMRQARVGAIERGEGAGAPLRVWAALGLAVGRPLGVSLSRDIRAEPADAGHLAIQELALRLAHTTGRTGTFELPTRPADPRRSIDVGVRDDVTRTLIVVEIWNRLDDLGAAMRRFDLEMAEAGALAAARGGDAYAVTGCWVLRDTAANRGLVARYASILQAASRAHRSAGSAP
jgi:transcriptional regulator with XRE-family HTH domain